MFLQQQQQQTHQPWNRGRSVPNLNPMSNNVPNRKPTSPNPGMSMSAAFASSQQCGINTSPMKYRRSTSFPGKVQGQNSLHHGNVVDISGQGQNNLSHGPIDMNALDDAREQFMQYQVSDFTHHFQTFYCVIRFCGKRSSLTFSMLIAQFYL